MQHETNVLEGVDVSCFYSFVHPDVINGKVGAVQQKDEGQTDANNPSRWSVSFVTGCV